MRNPENFGVNFGKLRVCTRSSSPGPLVNFGTSGPELLPVVRGEKFGDPVPNVSQWAGPARGEVRVSQKMDGE